MENLTNTNFSDWAEVLDGLDLAVRPHVFPNRVMQEAFPNLLANGYGDSQTPHDDVIFKADRLPDVLAPRNQVTQYDRQVIARRRQVEQLAEQAVSLETKDVSVSTAFAAYFYNSGPNTPAMRVDLATLVEPSGGLFSLGALARIVAYRRHGQHDVLGDLAPRATGRIGKQV
jgi:hypothetical protein